VIRGDGLYASIAAASILAKTWRDEYMIGLDNQFPDYGWCHNMGYPTLMHRTAIGEFGITPFHRKSFSLFGDPLELIF
jgi:ribonuclease HII